MTTPKVSIVIPAYNAEKVIARCLESIAAQTYANIEAVVVNDGSKDSTRAVCEELIGRYPDKITLINQENAGPSAARNNGIKSSAGEYVGFVDADDYIEPQTVEKMMTAIIENDAQMAVCGYITEKGSEIIECPLSYPSGLYTGEQCRAIAAEAIDDFDPKHLPPYSWVRITKKSIFSDNELYFSENLVRSEDYHLWVRVMSKIDRLYVLGDELLYHYIDTPNSITHRYIGGYWEGVKYICETLSDYLPKEKAITERIDSMMVRRSMIALNNACYCTDYGKGAKEIDTIVKDPALLAAVLSLSEKELKRYGIYAYMMKYHLRFAAALRYKVRCAKNNLKK